MLLSFCCLQICVTDLILERKGCGGGQSCEACRENPAKTRYRPTGPQCLRPKKTSLLAPARVPEWKTPVSDGRAGGAGRKDLDAQQLQGLAGPEKFFLIATRLGAEPS